MLQTLINFFQSIWDNLVTSFTLITHAINGFIHLFDLFHGIEELIERAQLALPDICAAFALITISVSIIFVILGRTTGTSD